ncbi:hypothetical protein H4582DRAFT_1830717 [Lactarius indigo]|nr:hypothetical protein H4582DRAFT_1830717 [Lactarius indigo]
MYNEKMFEFDSKLIQNWREDANSVMLLSGLISATVAGFLSQSYISSLTTSQDVSAFYLSQIYQLQANLNSSATPLVQIPPNPVSAPRSSHVLWVMSLSMSLVCAVSASLAQEWVRQYQLLTQLQYSPHRCARIRACITQDGFLKFVPLFLNILNCLLHTSIYFFFIGLVILAIHTSDLPFRTVGVVSLIV